MGQGSSSQSAEQGIPSQRVVSAHVSVPDKRPGDRRLRVSWHPETSTFVFSHWVEGLCVASTPVTVADAAEVARFLSMSLPLEAVPATGD